MVVGCAYSIIYVTHSLVQVLECNNIVQAMNILEGLIPGEDAPKPADANHLSKLFVFSLMWSVGALLELDDRKKVFLRWAWFASILLWRTFYLLFIYFIYLYAVHVRLRSPTSWAQRFSFNSENCTPHPPLCHQTWRDTGQSRLVLWIGHFRVSPGLCIKTRLIAQSLIRKWFFIACK